MTVKKLVLAMFAVGVVSGSAIAADQRSGLNMLRDHLTMGQPQAMYSKSGESWFAQHVTVNGQLNVDLGVSDKTRYDRNNFLLGPTGFFITPATVTAFGTAITAAAGNRSSSNINLYNSNISVDVQPINWVDGHIEFTGQDVNNIASTVFIDEAYVLLGDLNQSSFYLTAGRRYQPFGYYGDPHRLTPTLTQLLSEMNRTSIEVGFAQPCGFHLSGYIFRGRDQFPASTAGTLATVTDYRNNIANGGLDAGYAWGDGSGMRGFNVGLGWLYNMADVLAISRAYNIATLTGTFGAGRWHSSAGGLAANLGGHYANFDGHVSYVSALRRFSALDTGIGNVQPSALDSEIGYGFRYMGHEHRIAVGYQQTWSANTLYGVPERRWEADWTLGLWQNTKLQFQYTNDRDYSVVRGGTGQTANAGQVRLSVGFL
jgi:hypothetical protein